jgi:ribbon-helix-helix CopG family protein
VAPSPKTELRITPEEKRELQELAAKAGVPLSVAFRRGARVYLGALLDAAEMKEGRPPKGGSLAA